MCIKRQIIIPPRVNIRNPVNLTLFRVDEVDAGKKALEVILVRLVSMRQHQSVVLPDREFNANLSTMQSNSLPACHFYLTLTDLPNLHVEKELSSRFPLELDLSVSKHL